VLLQKGALLDLMHKPRSAATVYGHALADAGSGTRLPAPVERTFGTPRRRVRENAVTLAAAIDKKIGALRSTEPGGAQRRFDRCLDRILGRRRVYVPEPTFMLFPYLRNYEFFDREHFDWLATVEAATDSIRENCWACSAPMRREIEPYSPSMMDYR